MLDPVQPLEYETGLLTTPHWGFSGPMKQSQRNDRTEQQQLLRIPTGRRQTSWLFTSAR